MRDTRAVDGRAGESEGERRGNGRAEAAHRRLEHTRERASIARREAADAPDPGSAEVHREEAEVYDHAARLQDTAEKLQRAHVAEEREKLPDAPDGGESS
jgi:hypothetical protein